MGGAVVADGGGGIDEVEGMVGNCVVAVVGAAVRVLACNCAYPVQQRDIGDAANEPRTKPNLNLPDRCCSTWWFTCLNKWGSLRPDGIEQLQ